MGKIKDVFFRFLDAVKREYTRVDRTCNNCGREIFGGEAVGENLFCPDCFSHLPFNDKNVCAHCGRSTVNPEALCLDCAGVEWAFDVARSPFYYAPPIDELIRSQKYNNKRYLSEVFLPFLTETFVKNFSDADVITFVPMTDRAKKERGFNQSERMARAVSQKTGVPIEDLLEKTADTERQAKLKRDERLKNLKLSFKVRNKALIQGKTVVVIDDVLTTGATVEAISQALKKAGAKRVYALTVASVTEIRTARALGQETGGVSAKRKNKRLRS